MKRLRVSNIRNEFLKLKNSKTYSEDGNLEIISSSFIADEDSIFGEVSKSYCERELRWYLSESLTIKNMEKPIPKIWQKIAGSSNAFINSNYGYCIFSDKNYKQFKNAIEHLNENASSRRSVMIYIRPEMHYDYCKFGMNDFICTLACQLLIRNNKLYYIVYMRSNDVIFGYKNDKFWHNHVFKMALESLKSNKKYKDLEKGYMFWNTGSLHIYPRHFKLVEDYL